jgi:hypothetical protein
MKEFLMLRNRKKLIAGLLILISLGTISWFVIFEYGVRWLEKELEVVTTDLRQKGYSVTYSKVKFKGNPLFIRAIFESPHIKDPRGLFEWQGPEIEVSTKPWNLHTLAVSLPGDHTLNIPQGLAAPIGALKVEDASGVVTLTLKGKLEGLSLDVKNVFFLVTNKPQPLSLKDFSLITTNLTRPLELNMTLRSKVVGLETVLKIPPLDHLLTISVDAHLSGFEAKGSFPKTLSEWRDGGGVLDVSSLKLNWPPVFAIGEGTLTIDKDMYPLGSFSSSIEGYQEALDYMVRLGLVKKKNASAAAFVLDLMSAPTDMGTKRLTIPITLQNKRLSVGPVRVLKLKPFVD